MALDDAQEKQVIELTHSIGKVAKMAVLCRQRDARWFDDLSEEVVIAAVGKVATEDTSGRLTAAVGKTATEYFDGGAVLAADMYADEGRKLCPVSPKEPDLVRADQLVRTHRQPKNWSGAGGIK